MVLLSSKIVLEYFAKNVDAIVKDFGTISSQVELRTRGRDSGDIKCGAIIGKPTPPHTKLFKRVPIHCIRFPTLNPRLP
jgi:hypothetical protein